MNCFPNWKEQSVRFYGISLLILFFQCLDEFVREFLRRNLCPNFRGIQFRIVVLPVIIFFLADFSGFQFCSHLLPCMKRFEQMLIFFVLPVKPEAEFSVNLSDLNAIHIFQRKEGVHKTKIGVNVWDIDGAGAYPEDLCHFFAKISFWGSL